jgi:multisubunit Na+/H+ antiporter MnhE subunit
VAGRFQAIEVVLPLLVPMGTQIIQVAPDVDPGIVAVVEHELDPIVSHGLDRGYTDIFLAELQNLLPGTVTLNLSGGRIDSQILTRQLEVSPVII